jgi:hypothetical protein
LPDIEAKNKAISGMVYRTCFVSVLVYTMLLDCLTTTS